MSLREDLKRLANEKGSFKTIADRVAHVGRFCDFLQSKNIQIKSIGHVKGKYIDAFVKARKEAGISSRTLQNEVSALRVCLRLAGRDKLADQIKTKDLGIAGASRDGTKTAISDERFAELRSAVLAKNAGVAACVDLQRALGLRAEEAVKSIKSLDTWAKQLAAGHALTVIFGTKTGRPREVRPGNVDAVKTAVDAARTLAKAQGGVLVAKPNEKTAMSLYSRVMHAAGFVGREAGHSLRYAFAHDQMQHYQMQGFSYDEALALTSLDLGHGDGRGRYIEQVYGR